MGNSMCIKGLGQAEDDAVFLECLGRIKGLELVGNARQVTGEV